MIKATKKDLEKALEIVCLRHWADNQPNGECEGCTKALTSDECADCWKNYYINLAKEEGTK